MTSIADSMFGNVYNMDENLFATTVKLLPNSAVTYSENVPAIVEVMENESIDQRTGLMTYIHCRNYVIRKSDYKRDVVEVSPTKGDQILETVNGSERTFQCVPFGDDIQAFEEEFSDGIRWLIRTKEIYPVT